MSTWTKAYDDLRAALSAAGVVPAKYTTRMINQGADWVLCGIKPEEAARRVIRRYGFRTRSDIGKQTRPTLDVVNMADYHNRAYICPFCERRFPMEYELKGQSKYYRWSMDHDRPGAAKANFIRHVRKCRKEKEGGLSKIELNSQASEMGGFR